MSAMIRVAYITHYADLYGANRSLLELIGELQRRGEVEPHVLLPLDGPLVQELQGMSVPYRIVPFEARMAGRYYMGGPHHRLLQRWRQSQAGRARGRRNRERLPALIDQVKAWRVGLVHANSGVVSIAPDVASDASLPLVWHIREMLAAHYGLQPDEGWGEHARALRSADRLIGNSKAVREDVLHHTALVRPMEVIYNGVLPARRYGELRSAAGARWSRPGPFTFAMVGLIHPSKGHMEALEAFRMVIDQGLDARLIIAGEGRVEALRERIAALRLDDRVELAGFLPDVFGFYERSHALLMCSQHEAMGRVTVEAMASGIPVIAHASGGTLELIRDGEDGLFYKAGAGELAQHMRTLIADRSLAQCLGDRGSLNAEARFTVERHAEEVLRVYHEVLSAR